MERLRDIRNKKRKKVVKRLRRGEGKREGEGERKWKERGR